MKRQELNTTGQVPHFIGCWTLDPLDLCDELIGFFESHQELQTRGKMAGGINLDSKNSTDIAIRPRELEQPDHEPLRRYMQSLYQCHQDYLEQWPFLKGVMPAVDIGSFNLQRYDPGGHFQKVHSERTTVRTSHRVLAWMTYLNDVVDGGATRFIHQDLEVQPRQGRTLIWPAEWTHAHAGMILNSGVKYIITGWMHFPPDR